MKVLVVSGLAARSSATGAALVDVAFDLEDGEFLAVVGPSSDELGLLGAALAGRVRPTSGDVVVDGQPVAGRRMVDVAGAGLAHVPARHDVFPSLSAADHTRMARGAGRVDSGRVSQPEADLFPELAGHPGRRAGTLPPFERRLVAFARAVACRPRVLVIDEPASYVPDAWHDALFVRCRDLNRAGVAVVVLSTDADRALQLCDRGVVLADGRVVARGRGRQLLAGYDDLLRTRGT